MAVWEFSYSIVVHPGQCGFVDNYNLTAEASIGNSLSVSAYFSLWIFCNSQCS